MREKYIAAIIMLIAGVIVSTTNFIQKIELVTGLKRLLLALIIFYIIGSIVQAIIIKFTTPILRIEADETMDEIIEEQSETEELF